MKYFSVDDIPGTPAKMLVYLNNTACENIVSGRRPCVIIFPGGAYLSWAERESEPVALEWLRLGFQVCILHYSVRTTEDLPFLGDAPMQDGAAAIRYIRGRAKEWAIDPDKITVCGFSAGGHAAGCTGVFWNTPHIPGGDPRERPNAMILCYPVITGGRYAHRQSFFNLTGDQEPSASNDAYSLELHVSPETPPTFLWHTYDDEAVPAENTLLMAQALRAAKVPMEMHLYAHGPHGRSICTSAIGQFDPHTGTWFPLAVEWLDSLGLGGSLNT